MGPAGRRLSNDGRKSPGQRRRRKQDLARLLQGLALGAAIAVALAAQPSQVQQPKRGPKGLVSVKFSHAFHAKLGDISPLLKAAREKGTHLRPEGPAPGSGCQACHAGLAESDQKRRGLALMADCLVCHSKIEVPFSCCLLYTSDAADE